MTATFPAGNNTEHSSERVVNSNLMGNRGWPVATGWVGGPVGHGGGARCGGWRGTSAREAEMELLGSGPPHSPGYSGRDRVRIENFDNRPD